MKYNLDDIDRSLLDKLQQDATISIADLAFESNVSVASVQRRLKRLRDSKVILREVAIIDPKAVQQDMTFVVSVELERETVEQLNAFRRLINKEVHVQQSYYVTGEADFILICVVSDMAEFETLTHRLFFENSNVRRFRTSVVMSQSKSGLTVPLLANK